MTNERVSDIKRLLTIAGSDSGGGAGIQADLKTFHAFGCYGMTVLTSVTAQNTRGVQGVQDLPAKFVALQFESVASDIGVDAVKIGMLSSAQIARVVAKQCRAFSVPHLVVDPVMRAKSGDYLLKKEAIGALVEEILPLAELVTPNIPEAEALAGTSINTIEEMKQAAQRIREMGSQSVLIKGGHRQHDATDLLFDGSDFYEFPGDHINKKNTHGTGCTLSAAIAANLALGKGLQSSIEHAKKFVILAIQQGLPLGQGIGPLNHLVNLADV